MAEQTAPGLKLRPRRGGMVPYWIAPREAVKAGYRPKSVRLPPDDDPVLLAATCHRLHAEALSWLSGMRAEVFDGSIGTLIQRWLSDPESPYKRLKQSSRGVADVYAPKVKAAIGGRQIRACDGRDVQRWFRAWAGADDLRDPEAHLPRAHTMLSIVKSAVSFGIVCRLADCKEFSAILHELEFPVKRPRTFAPTAAQVEATRKAAHAAGAPSRALCYAIQFETTLRQWDVIGEWVPLSDRRPSAVIQGCSKWIGPTWAMVDERMVLRLTYGKTEDTSALRGVYDLSICPMVMEELQHVATRSGPLIVNEATSLPYRYPTFAAGWRADFIAAEMPKGMWCRDLRAGADTEASKAGASRDDRKKLMGHTTERQIDAVYDRDRLGAQGRVMDLRVAARKKKQ